MLQTAQSGMNARGVLGSTQPREDRIHGSEEEA